VTRSVGHRQAVEVWAQSSKLRVAGRGVKLVSVGTRAMKRNCSRCVPKRLFESLQKWGTRFGNIGKA
jgi:hypothetical protein